MSDASNLKDTILPKSDQLNAEQLLGAPMTITVTNVARGVGEQPVIVSYANDEGRPFKPCKTMRKVLIFAWGDDGREWAGKSMTLFCDPDVKFGGVKVGGIRISHLSDIDRDIALSLNTTKGKKGEFFIKKMAPRLAQKAPAASAPPQLQPNPTPTLAERLAAVADRFSKIGMTADDIAACLGYPMADVSEDELPALTDLYKAKKAEFVAAQGEDRLPGATSDRRTLG